MMSETELYLTVQDVQMAVERIREHQDDEEAAHSMEDELHRKVLTAIATFTCREPERCALAALETLKMDFARHCS